MNPPAAPSPANSHTKPPAPVRRPLDPRTVTAVLTAIGADSRREPQTFLRDTEVPFGGE